MTCRDTVKDTRHIINNTLNDIIIKNNCILKQRLKQKKLKMNCFFESFTPFKNALILLAASKTVYTFEIDTDPVNNVVNVR